MTKVQLFVRFMVSCIVVAVFVGCADPSGSTATRPEGFCDPSFSEGLETYQTTARYMRDYYDENSVAISASASPRFTATGYQLMSELDSGQCRVWGNFFVSDGSVESLQFVDFRVDVEWTADGLYFDNKQFSQSRAQ